MKKNCGSGGSNKEKTKLGCILEADESTRLRMGNSVSNYHEDHFSGKGDNSLQHYNLVHIFIPIPQAIKIPAAKAAVDKEWEERGTRRKDVGRKSSFCIINGHMSLEKCRIGGKAPKIKVELYSEVIL